MVYCGNQAFDNHEGNLILKNKTKQHIANHRTRRPSCMAENQIEEQRCKDSFNSKNSSVYLIANSIVVKTLMFEFGGYQLRSCASWNLGAALHI